MYSVYSDDICIHNDAYLDNGYKLIGPKLTLEDNSAGSFEMTIPLNNAGYDSAKRLASTIHIERDGKFFWEGRIINEKSDFQKQRRVTCEGELGYLNDTTQPPGEYHDYTVRQFLTALITEHNRKVDDSKKFTVGAVTVTDANDSLYRYTNNEKTFKCIQEKLVDRLGGHIRTRHADGVRYLDYLAEYPNTNTQEVRFGENLLDFTKNFDLTKLATVITPRGARLEESPIEALEAYTTVESVNGGSIYVTSEEAIKTYGWIEQVVDWNDVNIPANLLRKAKEYLKDVQFEGMVLKLSAFDLHHISKTTEPISLLDQVRCVSPPHGMDRYFPVTKMSIPLDQPDQATYTFGSTEQLSLTANNKKINSQILKRIDELPTKESILKAAKDNATALITMATNGFITITKNEYGAQELYITDTVDYTKATRLWRWNINGLGYSKDGGKTFGLAMTMDGAIVADFVTAGTMSADRVRTGILKSQNGNTSWDLNTGVLTMVKGSISLGNGRFSVDDSGYLTSTSGKIGGFNISTSAIYNESLYLDKNGLTIKRDDVAIGRIGTNSIKGYPTQRGLVFDLDPNGNYMAWAYKRSGGTDYDIVMAYAASYTNGFSTGKMNMGVDLDMMGHNIQNGWINPNSGGAVGGITGTMNFVKVNSMSSDGTVSSWSNGCRLEFKKGFLVGATF